MANKFRGEYEVKLGGEQRVLKFDLNSLCALEEELKVPLQLILKMKVNLKTVRAFLWAGLLHGDPSLTVTQVGAMLTLADLSNLQDVVFKAFAGAASSLLGETKATSAPTTVNGSRGRGRKHSG